MKRICLVVDMLNGFAKEGALKSEYVLNLIPGIKNYLEANKNDDNIFICDSHSKADLEMQAYPYHCLVNSHESKIVSELEKYVKKIVTKNTTNAIWHIDLNKIANYDEIVITGCCTDICVLQLALSLRTYFNSLNKNSDIIIYKNLVDTYDSPNHNRNEYNEFALKIMAEANIKIKEWKK